MRPRTALVLALSLGTLLSGRVCHGGGGVASGRPPLEAAPDLRAAPTREAYGSLPLPFEPNVGQADPSVVYAVRGQGFGLFLLAREARLALRKAPPQAHSGASTGVAAAEAEDTAVVSMRLLDASATADIVGLEPLPGVSHYLVGNDPARWHTDIPHFSRVEYKDVYPGVDLAFHGDARALEYDFLLDPGSDPAIIRLAFDGVTALRLDAQGNLVLEVPGGEEVVERAPVSYQIAEGGKRSSVHASYVLTGDCEVGFTVAGHDRTQPLVIDPVLAYSTYLGGSGSAADLTDDRASAIVVDAAGSAYVAGFTETADFPTVNPFQASHAGGPDAFVAKLDPTGSTLVYATYLGGAAVDAATGIAVDAAGNAYVTGVTSSRDFPTAGPFQALPASLIDAFVAKLAPSGSALVYSTYLGGDREDQATAIALDTTGSAYVTGYTASTNFPTTGALQTLLAGPFDAFVTKLAPSGALLAYSTYLGGSEVEQAFGIAVDGTGSAYLTGVTTSSDFPTRGAVQPTYAGDTDAFVAKLSPAGSALAYATYLGGSGNDHPAAIAVDTLGSSFIVGNTLSTDFPTARPVQPASGGGFDAFVAKLAPTGSALVYATYLGGSDRDGAAAVAIDAAGAALVTGNTSSNDFPLAQPLQAVKHGTDDVFVTKLDASGSALLYSTYLGGAGGPNEGGAIAVDGAGNAYVAGVTRSNAFPTFGALQPAYGGGLDAFVVKLSPAGTSLVYSTYLGGGGSGADAGIAIAVDASGNTYLTGTTASVLFPTANPAQATKAGGLIDLFVSKLDATGSTLLYSTYLGGTGLDFGISIAIDAQGSAYVVGQTDSRDFPTVSAVEPAFGGGPVDAFVAKLNPAGSALLYSSFLGGAGNDFALGVAVDAAGSAVLTGLTDSSDFPTANALQPTNAGSADAFVVKLSPAGSTFVYSTYLGGSAGDLGNDVRIDGQGNAYLTGSTDSLDFPVMNAFQPTNRGSTDAFVVKLVADGSSLVYSTYLGGSDAENGNGLAIDDRGSAYVTGATRSFDFPTSAALQPANAGVLDAFVTKLGPAGTTVDYSTYLGGSSADAANGIAVDPDGNAYVTGVTISADFPTVSALQAANGGLQDAFVAKLDRTGATLAYSTYLGGAANDVGFGIAVDRSGSAFIIGRTESIDFPTRNPLQAALADVSDAWVSKIAACDGLPGRVATLRAVKRSPTDVLLSWDPASLAAGGYHLYSVVQKSLIPVATVTSAPLCTAPAAGPLTCTDAGGLSAPPAARFYQVVAVCADGRSEGPL